MVGAVGPWSAAGRVLGGSVGRVVGRSVETLQFLHDYSNSKELYSGPLQFSRILLTFNSNSGRFGVCQTRLLSEALKT